LFGSHGGGVDIYNPKAPLHFTNDQGLFNGCVISIIENSRGNICLGATGWCLIIYDGEVFRRYTQNEGTGNNNPVSLV